MRWDEADDARPCAASADLNHRERDVAIPPLGSGQEHGASLCPGWRNVPDARKAARCNPETGEVLFPRTEREQVDRAQKREFVSTFHDTMAEAGVIVVAHYSGLSVAQMTDFRNRMKEAGGQIKVAKNRLAKRALEGTDAEGIQDLFQGPTCVAYSQDPVAAPKVAVEFAKKNQQLVILGGAMGKTVLDADNVKSLAELPSLDELRARLVGVVQAPAGKIAQVLNAPGAQLARVLQAKADKDEAA